MSDQPLWSERHGGGSLALSSEGFATLLVDAFKRLTSGGYFLETLGLTRSTSGYVLGTDKAKAFFAMKLGDPWAAGAMDSVIELKYAKPAQIFDLLEVLHRDVVSARRNDSSDLVFEQEKGRRRFREVINPILRRCDPPLELTEAGAIIERTPEPFRRLVEQPLPDTAPKQEVADRVADAVAHYRRRNATTGDRRAAVRELADVLEFLRADVKEHLMTQDERDLFRIANEFALRHNKPTTRRDFEAPVWLAWLFYVYLATIRLVLELKRRG